VLFAVVLLAVAVVFEAAAASVPEGVVGFPLAAYHQHHPSFSTCHETLSVARVESAQPDWTRLVSTACVPASRPTFLEIVAELAWRLVAEAAAQSRDASVLIQGEVRHCFSASNDRWWGYQSLCPSVWISHDVPAVVQRSQTQSSVGVEALS
jgi:hypothetical protein